MDSTTVPEPEAPPQRHHRVVIISGIVVVIIIIVTLVVGSIVLLRRSPNSTESASNENSTLPEADSGQSVQDDTTPPARNNPDATPTTIANVSPTATPATTIPSTVERQVQESLGVVIQYQQSTQFDLTIASVYRTRQIPTADFLTPANEFQPYSVVKVYDTRGNLISEHRFTVPTSVMLESADVDTVVSQGLVNSELTIVVPVAPGTTPGQVRVVGSAGQPFDTTSFVYEQLQRQDPVLPETNLSRWLPGINVAHAAGDPLKIVVVSQGAAAAVDQVKNSAEGLKNIAPWSDYAGDIIVTKHEVSLPLGCSTVTPGTGITYPTCPNSGQVVNQVQLLEPDWDAIVVVMATNCNCGTAFFGSRIVAVGERASAGLLAHEFGHGITALADEYMYKHNLIGPAGPNCFSTAAACESAIAPYAGDPAALCSLGCNAPQTYRPANRIMHNQYSILEYGPLERCFMGHAIAAILNRVHVCTTNQADDPTGEYWGGGR